MFNEDEKVVDAAQVDVVDQHEEIVIEEVEDIEDTVEKDEVITQDEPANDKPQQSKDENAAYASMRRKAEDDAEKKYRDQVEHYKMLAMEKEIKKESEAYAYEHGISEEAAFNMLKMQKENSLLKRKDQKSKLTDEPYFKELEQQIDDYCDSNPTVDVNTVYEYLLGKNHKKLVEQEKTATAKQAVENHKRQAKRGVESSDSQPTTTKTIRMTPEEKRWAESRVSQGLYANIKEAVKYLRS